MRQQVYKTSDKLVFLDDREWLGISLAVKAFTPEECQKIIDHWNEEESLPAMTRTIVEGVYKPNAIRRGRIDWISKHDEKYEWLMSKLVTLMLEVNDLKYGLLLDTMFEDVQLSRYLPGDKYGWHRDTGPNITRRRKLSFSLQLSDPADYEGGGFLYEDSEDSEGKEDYSQQGTLIVFPSFMKHRAVEVTKGVRWALVGWLHGPEWR